MNSNLSCDINDLVVATELNISRISAISNKFALPCLNEWRYATKHVALLLVNPDDSVHREKAIGHLKRAYFDSSDILLTILIGTIRESFDEIGNYFDVATKIFKDYPAWSKTCIEAQRLQYDPCDDRFLKARQMDEMSCRLIEIVEQINFNQGNLRSAIARERRRERLAAIGVIAAVISAVGAMFTIFR